MNVTSAPSNADGPLKPPILHLQKTIFSTWSGAGYLWRTAMNLQNGCRDYTAPFSRRKEQKEQPQLHTPEPLTRACVDQSEPFGFCCVFRPGGLPRPRQVMPFHQGPPGGVFVLGEKAQCRVTSPGRHVLSSCDEVPCSNMFSLPLAIASATAARRFAL